MESPVEVEEVLEAETETEEAKKDDTQSGNKRTVAAT